MATGQTLSLLVDLQSGPQPNPCDDLTLYCEFGRR